MILLLALLPFLVSSSDPPQIDWSTCLKDKCIVASECVLESGANPNTLKDLKVQDPKWKEEKTCSVGLKSRFFSENVALFQMQVIGQAIASKKLHLKIENLPESKDLVGCELIEGSVRLIGDVETITRHNIRLFEDRSRIEPGHVLCAFTMEGVSALSKSMNLQIIRMILTGETLVEYPYDNPSIAFFSPSHTRCDTYSMNDQSTSRELQILPIKNIDRNTIDCTNYGPSYFLKYENASGTAWEIKELRCDDEANFVIVTNDGTPPQTLEDPEEYSFYCAARFAEICQKPACTEPNCPHFTPGVRGNEATLECDEGKWLIEDEYHVLERQPKCQQDTISNLNEAAFFVDLPSEKDLKLEAGARCFVHYDCKKKSKLDYPRCKTEDSNCGDLDFSDGKMQCKDNKRQLNVRFGEKTVIASSYSCNKSTGNWEDSKFIVPGGARVACIANKTRDVTVNLSPAQLYAIIGSAIVGCLGLSVVISIGIYCYYNPAAIFKVKNKHSWVRMSREGKIAYCKKKFAQIREAASNTERIVYGLKLIELLLETETVEMKCWDEAYLFLMQVHGALKRAEDTIARLFGRYLFLHAKKIIDNHGWTSEKPITNKKKHDKGLMRCVAIRLLEFAVDYDLDATLLILTGFTQLGWEAVDQYPHCGLLWSAVPFARPGWIRCQKSYVRFDSQKFVDILHEIAFNSAITMPDEDVIPSFGSPSNQAAFALGGSTFTHYQVTSFKDILKKSEFEKGALSFFKGINAASHHNPAVIILSADKTVGGVPDKETQKNLKKSIPESELNAIFEHALKIMLYYGRALDFKKLHHRYIPESTQLMSLFNELHRNVKLFDETAQSQKEDLRKWFAGQTDKEELKKKPVMIKDPALIAALSRPVEKKGAPPPPPSSITKPADPPVDPFSDALDSTKGTTPPASSDATQSQKP